MKLKKTTSGYFEKWSLKKEFPFCVSKAEIDEFSEAEAYEPSYYYQGEKLRCFG